MKKILLTFAALAAITLSANAQTARLSLLEEYTGENCDPCAAYNPAFWTLLSGGTNPSEIMDITYMEPIPSTGWFYMQDEAVSDARISYYQNWFNIATGTTGEEFTPSDVQDGHYTDATTSSPMNIASFTQSDIDSMHGVSSPFSITVVSSWDATYSNITSVITVTNTMPSTYAPASANFYLRLALVENVVFSTPPGTNGEDTFRHVVRQMFPNATGTAIPESWAVGATQTYTITGACPNYVNKAYSPFMVAWVQNDNDLTVQQAAVSNLLSAPPVDASITAATGPSGLVCAPAGPYTVSHTATLLNNGTATLTSATIYYSIDGGTMSSYDWTGTLAASTSTPVTMPTASTTVAADLYHTIYDSVANPNGAASVNPDVAAASSGFFIENSTAASLPYGTSFENSDTNFYATDNSNDGNTWGIYYSGTSTSLAYAGTYAEGVSLAACNNGEQNVLVMPETNITTPGSTSLTFYEAYAQIDGSSSDALDVVYSTDCGDTWTSIWTLTGSSMVTMSPSSTEYVIPTSPSNYALRTVSLSSVPSGSVMLGLRFTANGGNTMWVDNVSVQQTTGIQNLATATDINLYPNPAKNQATLSFNLASSSDVQVQVIDGLGRVMNIVANDNMNAGAHTYTINTETLANGVYNVTIHTNAGTFTHPLSVMN